MSCFSSVRHDWSLPRRYTHLHGRRPKSPGPGWMESWMNLSKLIENYERYNDCQCELIQKRGGIIFIELFMLTASLWGNVEVSPFYTWIVVIGCHQLHLTKIQIRIGLIIRHFISHKKHRENWLILSDSLKQRAKTLSSEAQLWF